MTELKPYPKYKESGVEWIGEIPVNWMKVKVGYVYEVTLGKMIQTQPKNKNDKLTPYLKANNVQENYINYDTVDKMYANPNELKTYELRRNDLLVCEGGEVARAAFVDENSKGLIFQNALHRVRNKKHANLEFLYYLLFIVRKSGYINILVNRATIAHFTKDKFTNLEIPFPDLNVQNKISEFLNKKTSEIDSLISDKQNLIKLLEEKRQAIITETVTKGLDPNVKMKDSGVEWIGEIPEHWKVVKLKHVTMLRTKKSNKNLPYLGLENVEGKTGKIIEFNTNSNVEVDSLEFFKSDVLFGKLRPYLRKCIVAPQEGQCTSEFLVLKSNAEVLYPTFLKNIMLSNDYIENINSSTYGAKMPRASWGFIGNVKIPLPIYSEQIKIMKEITQVTKIIYELQEDLYLQIAKLKEYRESLIYEVVTGKIDLRSYNI